MTIDTAGLTHAFRRFGEQYEERDPVYRATVISDDSDDWWTVRYLNPDSSVQAAVSVRGAGTYNLGSEVRVSKDRKRWGPNVWAIIDANRSAYIGTSAPPNVQRHGSTHGDSGSDRVYTLGTSQLYELRGQARETPIDGIRVLRGLGYAGGEFERLAVATNVSLAVEIAALGAGERQYVVISLDSSGALNKTEGTPKVGGLTADDIPDPPWDEQPICAVDIRVNDTQITNDRIEDLRFQDSHKQHKTGKKQYPPGSWMDGSAAPTLTQIGDYIGEAFTIGDSVGVVLEVPERASLSDDLTLKLYWACDEAYALANGEVQWACAYSAVPSDESEALDGAGYTGDLDPGDQDIPANAKELTVTTLGVLAGASLAVGDIIGLEIERVALDGGVNPTAEPVGVLFVVEYVIDKPGA